MFGWNDLKERIALTDATVECPVRDCDTIVERQRRTFRREAKFGCPAHAICISPSTFEYEEPLANMLWTEPEDLDLWRRITQPGIKRESRIAFDNSEDAVTWNVFRHLARRDLLGHFITAASGRKSTGTPRLVYWSWCQQANGVWQPLVKTAVEFGETQERRSEPDLVIEDDVTLLFVEAKLTSGNRTRPSNPANEKKYETAFDRWFSVVFQPSTTFVSVAVKGRLYELMRLWLIGTLIAAEARKQFVLVNVVRDGTEADITARCERHARFDNSRQFVRLTWEQIRDLVVLSGPPDADMERLLVYFRTKTLGYTRRGRLRRAFAQAVSENK